MISACGGIRDQFRQPSQFLLSMIILGSLPASAVSSFAVSLRCFHVVLLIESAAEAPLIYGSPQRIRIFIAR